MLGMHMRGMERCQPPISMGNHTLTPHKVRTKFISRQGRAFCAALR